MRLWVYRDREINLYRINNHNILGDKIGKNEYSTNRRIRKQISQSSFRVQRHEKRKYQ